MTATEKPPQRTKLNGICEAVELIGHSGYMHVILDGVGYVLLAAAIDDPREGPETVTLHLTTLNDVGPDRRTTKYLFAHERVIWTRK